MKKIWLVLPLGAAVLAVGVGAFVHRARQPASAAAAVTKAATGERRAGVLEAARVIYEGKLSEGWEDWGWGPHRLGEGPAQVVFEGYGGIILHHAELPWQFGGVAFRYQADPSWGDFMRVSLHRTGSPDDSFPMVVLGKQHMAQLPDGWREVFVDWKELNPERRPFDRLQIAGHAAVGPDWVQLDHVILTKPTGGDAAQKGDRRETLHVSCDGGSHPISELIYGSSSDVWDSGQSAKRMGGNPLSRMNWELGVWNTGKDWYFENVGGEGTLFDDIDQAAKAGHQVALVVPMLGWVAKDNKSFSFPRKEFGAQKNHDPKKPEAGDGFSPEGKPLVPKGPERTSLAAPPELIGKWLQTLVERAQARGSRGVHQYILDNEPSLWNETHRDVHPEPVSYDELLQRTVDYASVIRATDPEAVIAGPAEWGWLGYFYSGLDREKGVKQQPDRGAHGGTPLVPWYLRKLNQHERATGKRLLDVLDLHFYPAAEGVFGSKTDAETALLRVRSTRSLWDPTYRDESWIDDTIRLIPRMKEWVRDNYRGRKISLGEWSFGAEDHISGGLATAEALGRFGQQGLDSAFHWGDLKPETPTYWAFRAFRNFDGKGARFLDLSLPVKETEMVSLFASRDAGRRHMVLVLINRDPGARVGANVTLEGCGSVVSSRMFSYGEGAKALKPVPVQAKGQNLVADLEPFSFAVVDLQVAGR